MHRSGTSVLGSLLPACGIAMPGSLITGDTHNPEGYFERADVTDLQEQLLIDLERWWPSPRGIQTLPDGWLESPRGQQALAQLIELLKAEQIEQQGGWAIKDPRSSLLLPLWTNACQQLAIPLQLVLAVRDPAEVMVSLVRRDQSATGMDSWRAQRLWWHHNAQVLHEGRDLPLQVVSYSNWFAPQKGLQQLLALAPTHSLYELREILASTVKTAHRRSHLQALPGPLAPQVKQFHQRLEALALDPSQRDNVLRWLNQQPELPAVAPLPRLRSRLKRHVNSWRGKPAANFVASHPWGYLVEMVCGSQGPGAEHLLASWLEHGFRDFELARFASLPGPRPSAEPWSADGTVSVQVRGGDLNQRSTHAWLHACPIEGDAEIKAVPYGSVDSTAVLLNLDAMAFQPGPAGAAELLRWSKFERIWDPDPERVRILRQFGVRASWLRAQNSPNFRIPTPPAEPWRTADGTVSVQVRGADLHAWATHAWLQHCPIDNNETIEAKPYGPADATGLLINVADVVFSSAHFAADSLHAWRQRQRVWDPDPERVQMLRHLGVNASCLQQNAPTNNYLRSATEHWARCSELLGLAAPADLARLGSSLCLGRSSPELDGQLEPPLLGIPGFAHIQSWTPEQAKLLALWLQECLQSGLELVVFQTAPSTADRQNWNALVQPNQPGKAPILLLNAEDPIGPSELLNELSWYRQGCPAPPACNTPKPTYRVVVEHHQNSTCTLAVCISLYNYGLRIHQALESVLAQQEINGLELIVVDDASSDDGAAVVEAWMAQHHSRFARCLLLQHSSNSGLASARNTAFVAAQSPWCFVLDADNQLDPLALAHCGQIAAGSDPHCAVIHSLIRVETEPGCHDPRHLISDQPWQQEVFKLGNYIDAMALVRRDAWQAVGGYTHIPGGWEDFDFWCGLIDAGWHGVLCPQVLATYNSHRSSMRNSDTNKHTYRLSRLLQARHPWLELRQAKIHAVWPSS